MKYRWEFYSWYKKSAGYNLEKGASEKCWKKVEGSFWVHKGDNKPLVHV